MKYWIRTLPLIMLGSAFFSQAADNEVAPGATTIQPLLIGAATPSVNVNGLNGETIDLAHFVKEEPTILIFFRGSWCPYCMKQLGQLQKWLPKFKEAGFRIVTVTQDSAEMNKKTQKKYNFGFPILSDSSMAAAKAYGLVFEVDQETITQYKSYNIDLVGLYGRTQPLMAVPGIFLSQNDGVIRFQYVNPDYRIRLAPEVLLAAANSQ